MDKKNMMSEENLKSQLMWILDGYRSDTPLYATTTNPTTTWAHSIVETPRRRFNPN